MNKNIKYKILYFIKKMDIYENSENSDLFDSSSFFENFPFFSFFSFFSFFIKTLFFLILSFFIVFLIHQILNHFYTDSQISKEKEKEKMKEDLNTYTHELINKNHK